MTTSPVSGRHSAASLTALAVDLVAANGLDALTIRSIARRAGVFPTVVYHHIGDLDAVRFAVADAVVDTIDVPPPLRRPAEWRNWLVELAQHTYGALSGHQGVFPFIARTGPSSPSQIRVIDACMQLLSEAGLDDRDASFCYGAYINQVGSSAEIAAVFALHDRGDGQRRAQFGQQLRNVAALHPGLQRALPHFESWDHVTAFAYSLDLILDGIDRRLRSARRT